MTMMIMMKKAFSVITLICFILSSVAGSLPADLGSAAEKGQAGRTINDPVIPPSLGRITDRYVPAGAGNGMEAVPLVINIQDIHCNPEVQKNIAKILSELDRKYGLDRVYVEGGYGDIDTSWLCNISDAGLKKEITENLLKEGRLTGSEYYSVLSGKPYLLKGIEDRALHRQNLARLNQLQEKRSYFETQLQELDDDLALMKARYMSPGSRKFSAMVVKHRKGAMNDHDYYRSLLRYAAAINKHREGTNALLAIETAEYPEILRYVDLLQTAKSLNYRKISRQMQEFARTAKSHLSFNVYSAVLTGINNSSDNNELYSRLARIAKTPEIQKANRSLVELYRFIDYNEKCMALDPARLINEEKQLVEEIRAGLTRDVSELEVAFLTDHFNYFRDYALCRLSADDHAYFVRHFGTFKRIWGKYALTNRMDRLSADCKVLDEYYEVNEKRNSCFIENIRELTWENGGKQAKGSALPSRRDVSGRTIGPEIIVVVTGGFHTRGLKQILEQRGYPFLAVAPVVTENTETVDRTYRELVHQQAVVSNALALALASQLSSNALFELAVRSADRKLKEAGITEKERLIKEIEKSVGARVAYDAEKGLITFANGAVLQLGQDEDSLEVKGIRPAASLSGAVRGSIKTLADVEDLSACLIRGDVDALFEKLLRFAAEYDLLSGNGLIYEITNDPALKNADTIGGIEKEVLGRLPEPAQKVIAERDRKNRSLNAMADRSEWLRILLAVDLLRDHLQPIRFPDLTVADRSSIINNFTDWNGVIACGREKTSFIMTNPSKFFPEEPEELVAGLKNFYETGRITPVRVDIDITNFCNNNCTMCFNAEFIKSERVMIPAERVINIFENLKAMGTVSVRFTGGGDPLMHKDFKKFLIKAHELGFKTTLETNGDGLTDEVMDVLCRYATHVRVSIDAASNKKRAEIHRAKNKNYTLDRLVGKLETLVAKRKEAGREDELMLGATFVINPENYNEVYGFSSLMHRIGFDWIAIRKNSDQSFYRDNPEKEREALRQYKQAKKDFAGRRFKIAGPYGVTRTPGKDFEKCLVAATRGVILANSTLTLCCLKRSNDRTKTEIDLGKIDDGAVALLKKYPENREKIKRFFKLAPAMCDICIDADFNRFLNEAGKILKFEPESDFSKVRIIFYDGDDSIVCSDHSRRDIMPVFMPRRYRDRLKENEIVSLDESIGGLKHYTGDLDALAKNYERAKEKVRSMDIRGGDKASLYTDLDRSTISMLKGRYLKASTGVLLSGSQHRGQGNYYSDFDLVIIEEDGRSDRGVGPFINALKAVTGKVVQVNYGTRSEIKKQFFVNPWERMTILDSEPLDSKEGLLDVIGLPRSEQVRKKIVHTAFFYLVNNLLMGQKSMQKPDSDIDLKHDAGCYKYLSFFISACRLLSVDIKREDREFIDDYFDFLFSFRDRVQSYYGQETRVIGNDYISYRESNGGLEELDELERYRTRTVELFNAYLPQLLGEVQRQDPGLYGYDLLQMIGKLKNNKFDAPTIDLSMPELARNTIAAFSLDADTLAGLLADTKASDWLTLYLLAGNEHLSSAELSKLALLKGYENRDIRYQVAKNKSADEAVLRSLIDDCHPPTVKAVRQRLNKDAADPDRSPIIIRVGEKDFWYRDVERICSIITDNFLDTETVSGKDSTAIANLKKELSGYPDTIDGMEYDQAMTDIFSKVNAVVDDPFKSARETLNSSALRLYKGNKSFFDSLTLPQLLIACSAFNRFDGILKKGDVDRDAEQQQLLKLRRGREALPLAENLLNGSKTVGLVTDNYGELLVDLLLVQKLLRQNKQVTLFTRRSPFMIADATEKGLYEFIGNLSEDPAARAMASELQKGLDSGRLRVTGTDAFTDGNDLYREGNLGLLRMFEELDLLIIKGDWNYKSAIGLKNWRYNDPVKETDIQYLPTDAILLRTIKSPVIVGEKSPLVPGREAENEMKVVVKKQVTTAAAKAARLNGPGTVFVNFHAVEPVQLNDVVAAFGGVETDRSGNRYANIYVIGTEPEDADNWSWHRTGISVDDKEVWAGTSAGVLVLFAEGADNRYVASVLDKMVTDHGRISAADTVRVQFMEMLELTGAGRGAIDFKPGMIIDHRGDEDRVRYNEMGGMIVPAGIFYDSFETTGQEAIMSRLNGLLTVRNAESVAIPHSIFIYLDKLAGFNEFMQNLEAFNRVGNCQMIVDPAVFAGLSEKKVKAIARLARKSGVIICVDLKDNASLIQHYRDAGFPNYMLAANNGFRIYDTLSGDHGMKAALVSGYENAEQLRVNLGRTGAACKILNLSDLKGIMKDGQQNIIDRVFLTETLKAAVLGLYTADILSENYVRDVGYAWEKDQLPPVHDAGALADSLSSGSIDQVRAALGIKGTDHPVNIFLEKIRTEERSTDGPAGQEVLQRVFLTAIAEKSLARILLESTGKNAGLADGELEIILGKKLLQQQMMHCKGQGAAVSPEEFIAQNKVSASVFYEKLNIQIRALLEHSDDPLAINAIIELIPSLAEPKRLPGKVQKRTIFNANSVLAVLKAA